MYKSVELFDGPEKEIEQKFCLDYSEMTAFQRSFLCGLIKEKRPEKIVEIGVAAGATTALILQCLQTLAIEAEVYSVDLMLRWYRNEKYETGFIAKKILHNLGERIKHKFLMGSSIPFFLEQIGDQIDFLILDTTHALPGELLDFVICLPFLKEDCVVVMHDIVENHLNYNDSQIATKLLFDVVRAEKKYYMWEDELNIAGLSNIAAFRVGKETKDNVRDLFSAMTLNWQYILRDIERNKYREVIREYYGEEYGQLFDRIELLQMNTQLQKRISEHYGKDAEYLKIKWKREKKIFLYGAGHFAKLYYEWARLNHLNMEGIVISDEQEKLLGEGIELPIYYLSEMPFEPEKCAVVIAVNKLYQGTILQNLKKAGYDNIL